MFLTVVSGSWIILRFFSKQIGKKYFSWFIGNYRSSGCAFTSLIIAFKDFLVCNIKNWKKQDYKKLKNNQTSKNRIHYPDCGSSLFFLLIVIIFVRESRWRGGGGLCACAPTRALKHAPLLERPPAATPRPLAPRRIEKIPTPTPHWIFAQRIKTVKCKSMHCGRLECSANPGSRTAFHQMQYDSNYHTQVVCQRSDIVDNDDNYSK